MARTRVIFFFSDRGGAAGEASWSVVSAAGRRGVAPEGVQKWLHGNSASGAPAGFQKGHARQEIHSKRASGVEGGAKFDVVRLRTCGPGSLFFFLVLAMLAF